RRHLRVGAGDLDRPRLGEPVIGRGLARRPGPGRRRLRARGRSRRGGALSAGGARKADEEHRGHQRRGERPPPEGADQRSSTSNVHSLLPRKLNGMAPATAIACDGSSGAAATSTSRYRNTRLTPSARRLTVKNRMAWKPAWASVALNVQCRLRRKLFETATQNDRTAAIMWCRPNTSVRSAKTRRLTTYPLPPTTPNLNSWTQFSGFLVPRWMRRRMAHVQSAARALASRARAPRRAGARSTASPPRPCGVTAPLPPRRRPGARGRRRCRSGRRRARRRPAGPTARAPRRFRARARRAPTVPASPRRAARRGSHR